MSTNVPSSVIAKTKIWRSDPRRESSPEALITEILEEFDGVYITAFDSIVSPCIASAENAWATLKKWIALILCASKVQNKFIAELESLETIPDPNRQALLITESQRFEQFSNTHIIPYSNQVTKATNAIDNLTHWRERKETFIYGERRKVNLQIRFIKLIALLIELLIAAGITFLLVEPVEQFLEERALPYASVITFLVVFLIERLCIEPRLNIDDRKANHLRDIADQLIDDFESTIRNESINVAEDYQKFLAGYQILHTLSQLACFLMIVEENVRRNGLSDASQFNYRFRYFGN